MEDSYPYQKYDIDIVGISPQWGDTKMLKLFEDILWW